MLIAWIALAILLLFWLYLLITGKQTKKGLADDEYHVISARYNKPVDFLEQLEWPYTVIQKGVDVPNVANEATSYLHYIIQNYDNLPKNSIFIHDEDESWHHEGKITENLKKWIQEYETSADGEYYNFNNKDTGDLDPDWHKTNPALQSFLNTCFKESPVLKKTKCCAQFIVSRDRIRQRPKEFYETMNEWFLSNTDGQGNGREDNLWSGFWTGRYAEYTWDHVFGSSVDVGIV
jgi:hypothetical protein